MRIPKEQPPSGEGNLTQCELFEDDRYTYRIFCTSLNGKPHKTVSEYDKRADVENLVGESKREGLEAIPSAKFKNNYAYFQIVMLAFNLWRYFKMMAEISNKSSAPDSSESTHESLKGLTDNQIRIARLKLLLIGAKVVFHSTDKMKYSIMDSRTPGLLHFLNYLDRARSKIRPWLQGKLWPCRFSLNMI